MDGQAEEGSGWSTAVTIPGWKEITLPFGLAASGSETVPPGALHLVGSEGGTGILRYSSWDGERWTAPEFLDEKGFIGKDLGTVIAARPQGAELAVTWLALPPGDNADHSELFFTSRAIPSLDMVQPTQLTSGDTQTPEAASSPTVEPTVAPSATPNLNGYPAPSGSNGSIVPLAMGGILAALAVIGVFSTTRFLSKRMAGGND
jgi:hypothetical protein